MKGTAGDNYYRQRRRPGEWAGTDVPKNRSPIIIRGRGWALELKKPETWKRSKIVRAIKNDGYDC